MDLLGDVVRIPRQRWSVHQGGPDDAPGPRGPVPGASGPRSAGRAGRGWVPGRRRLVASWLLVVVSLWALHAAVEAWGSMRAWDASLTCSATDTACLAQHDVTTQPVHARVEVTDHVARIMLMPSTSGEDGETRTTFLRLSPGSTEEFARTTLADVDLDAELHVLRHDGTALGLVDADGTRWSGLHVTRGSLHLLVQLALLGLVAGWFAVSSPDRRPLKVMAVSAAVLSCVAVVGAPATSTWGIFSALLLAAGMLSVRAEPHDRPREWAPPA